MKTVWRWSALYCRGAPVGSEAPGGRALGADVDVIRPKELMPLVKTYLPGGRFDSRGKRFRERLDARDVRRDASLGHFQVVAVLQIEPELRAGAEQALQAQSRVDGHRGLPPNKLLDPRASDVQPGRDAAGREAIGLQELFQQDFAKGLYQDMIMTINCHFLKPLDFASHSTEPINKGCFALMVFSGL